MIKNIKTKKIFALVTVVFFTLSFLPIVQASDVASKGTENAMHVILSTDELLAKYAPGITTADIVPLNEEYIRSTPRSTDIPRIMKEALKEDEDKLTWFRENYVPNQSTLQDTTDNNGQGSRVAYANVVDTIVIIDLKAYDYFRAGLPDTPAMRSNCCAWVNSAYVEDGDDFLELWYEIDFQSRYFDFWDSSAYTTYSQLLAVMQSLNPSSVGCDTVILVTGASAFTTIGTTYLNGTASVMSVNPLIAPRANLFQHEVSHQYNCDDHLSLQCMMSAASAWWVRSYCNTCDGLMNANKAKYT